MKTTNFLNVRKVFLIFLFLGISSQIYSQDCLDLIKQGIREYSKEITSSQNSQEVFSKVCEAYNEYKSDRSVAKTSGKFKSIFKGSAEYSREQIETIGKMYCEENYSFVQDDQIGNYERTFIDPNFASMYIECVRSKRQQISLQLQPSDEYNQSITITASYSTTGPRPKVTGITYDQNLLDVNGALKNAALSNKELIGFLTLVAKRKDVKTIPFTVGTEKLLANAHQMVIQFETGAITITFPKIYPKPPKIELKKGIGEIVSSMLTKEKFYELYNKDGERWVLADGSDTPIGTAYKTYSSKLPDLRGMFLRGANNGRNVEQGGNPENKQLGEVQEDALKNHQHKFNFEVGHTINGNGNSFRLDGDDGSPWEGHTYELKTTGTEGNSSETRPRNVTVNYFIRIN